MSARYPFGMTPAFFPARITMRLPDGRDAYGKVTTSTETVHSAKVVTQGMVEMIDNGMRAMRRGISVVIAADDVQVGAELIWNGEVHTVIGVNGYADPTNTVLAWTVTAIIKRGT